MKRSDILRGFRMSEKKSLTSSLRMIRQAPKIGDPVVSSSNNSAMAQDLPDSSQENGSSKSPNGLEDEPPLPTTSKLFFVNPLTQEEIEERQKSLGDLEDMGFSMNLALKNKVVGFNGNCTDNSDTLESTNECSSSNNNIENIHKRNRIESDSEDTGRSPVLKRCCISDYEESNDEEPKPAAKKKLDPEMIEKLLDTYYELYPLVDKMEIYDTMKAFNFNFSEMTKKLEVRNREENNSMKNNTAALQTRVNKIQADKHREIEKKKKRAEAKRSKAAWKMKARLNEQDEEEEEDDDYIGKFKVYESDSSEDEDSNESESVAPARKMVVDLFNENSLSELSCLPGCSIKKAEILLQRRPFDSWEDLVNKIRNERNISTDLLNAAKDMIQMRNAIRNLMRRCESISSEINNCVTEIINEEDTSELKQQPKALNPDMMLKNYQLIGLNWLALMHDQGLNGVLADEMGLGKTIQAIAFLAYLLENGELEDRFSLIVVPSSTLDNWARELKLWCPSLGFLTYHGSQEERRGMRMAIMNAELEDVYIILTTYSMVTSNTEDRALFKKLPLHTIVYDEAHMLKNMASQRYENLMKIKCERRLLLTGTPLQNNLVELMSILIFVMPQLFEGKKDELKKVFSMFPKGENDKSAYEKERIKQAQKIMAPFFLRRLKVDVLKDLPLKSEEIIRVRMNEKQNQLYKNTVKTLSQRAEEIKEELVKTKLKDVDEVHELNASTGSENQIGVSNKSLIKDDNSSNMLMKLRKLANHPLLIRDNYDISKIRKISKILKKSTHRESVLDYIIEDFSVMSDFEIHKTCLAFPAISHFKLSPEVIVSSGKMEKLDEMLPDMKKNGDRVLIFSQFVMVLDILQEYIIYRGYKYRRLDGQTPVETRQEMIDEFNEDGDIFVFLLSTRAGGLGINLCSANTVIIHDVDFNPYNDKQAEDRCHRVGQTRDVKVYRFLSAHSIEEGMYTIAQSKLQLEKDVTGKGDDVCKADVLTLLKTALQVDTD